jgi:very-short-patch-repair endonuclease
MRLSVIERCREWGLVPPMFEYEFHPVRKWRFDFCWPAFRIAVEQEGGIWSRGRHTRGKGYLEDMEKYNAAIFDGWRLYRFTPQQVQNGDWYGYVKEILSAGRDRSGAGS